MCLLPFKAVVCQARVRLYGHSVSRVPWLLCVQRRRCSGTSEGNRVLQHIAEHHVRQFHKYSLDDLLELHKLDPTERLRVLVRELHVGISKIIVCLRDLPLGFSSVGSIQAVIRDYVQDIRDLCQCSPDDEEHTKAAIHAIFIRHRGMLGQIATGLREFQSNLSRSFEPFGNFENTDCAHLSELVPPVRRIELALDDFFTMRTTLRLLIAHCIQVNPTQGDDLGKGQGMHAMHQLLWRVPDSLRSAKFGSARPQHVGAICMETRPSLILIEAYEHAKYMCHRDFGRASTLLINDIPSDEFLSASHSGIDGPHFPYVDIHLYFVFFEVLKNALLTSIRKTSPGKCPPPIRASLNSGTSLLMEDERSVKIADLGEGISKESVRKVWSYFYSTVTPTSRAGEHGRLPLAGRGLGLPVSRVLARYFSGEIDLHSIPKRGTDVYIYV